MKNHRKSGLFLAVLLLICALGGCAREDSSVQVIEHLEEAPEYLSFFSYTSMSGSDVTKFWIDRFTETYNKQVYISFEGAAYYADEGLSYRELLEKRMQSSAPDDLFLINAEDVLAFDKMGYLMDLSDMDFVNNLSEAALYQSTYNGKVYSVPLSFTGFGFVWNLDMLEANGLTRPENMGEFLHVCEVLKGNGILPYGSNKGYALTVPAMCIGLSRLYGNADQAERIAALNSGETLMSSYMRDGFSFLEMMIDREYMDPVQSLSTAPQTEDIEMFLAEGCAFICIQLGTLYDISEADFEMELAGLPLLENGSIAVYGANNRLSVNPNSKHLDTALEFIEMVGSTEALEESASWEHVMSSSKEGDNAGLPQGDTLVELLRQPGQIPNQDFSLYFNTWESIRDVGRELCSGISVDEACQMLDEKQLANLEEYKEQ